MAPPPVLEKDASIGRPGGETARFPLTLVFEYLNGHVILHSPPVRLVQPISPIHPPSFCVTPRVQ